MIRLPHVRGRGRPVWTVWLLVALGGSVLTAGLVAFRVARLGPSLLPEPTRLYARPLALGVGTSVQAPRLEAYLKGLGYVSARGRSVGRGEYRFSGRTWEIGRRAYRIGDRLVPGGTLALRMDHAGRVLDLRDREGHELRSVTLEPLLLRTVYGDDAEDRRRVRLDEVPRHLVDAVLAVEDRRFFDHGGLDVRRIFGALVANVRHGQVVQGGSTLAQQLAKNLYLSRRRSILRKIPEALLAVALEARYSKKEILEAYLNEVYLGQDGRAAIHGVGRAALFFFGKDVTELDAGESALLAGLIRGPSLYAPRQHPEAALKRRNFVLSLMRKQGRLAEGEAERATEKPLGVREAPRRFPGLRYFTDYLDSRLPGQLSSPESRDRGVSVFTTLDFTLQEAAQEAVQQGLRRLEKEHPGLEDSRKPLQAALVVLDPRTGQVLAMVGGRDYGASQFNRAVAALRQPGSLFKPVVALAALSRRDDGSVPFTLASRLEDEALEVRTGAGVWRPANYDGRFRGPVTLREALQSSLNVPFARLGLAVGPERIVETARSLGVQSPLAPYPSLALGASEVTLLEMTRAYGVLAAGGYRAEPRAILGTVGPDGTLHAESKAGERVFDPAEAFLVTSALRGVVEWGTGQRLERLGVTGAVAGKTGTTNGFRDAWFVGYTPEIVAGVWVGFDDGRSLRLPGSAAALPIFADFLRRTTGLHVEGTFRAPRGLELVEVDPETGLRAGFGCPGNPEMFLSGTSPKQSCSPWQFAGSVDGLKQWLRGRLENSGATRRQVKRELRRQLKALRKEMRRWSEAASSRQISPEPR